MKQKLTLLLSFLTTLMVAWLVMSCDDKAEDIIGEPTPQPYFLSQVMTPNALSIRQVGELYAPFYKHDEQIKINRTSIILSLYGDLYRYNSSKIEHDKFVKLAEAIGDFPKEGDEMYLHATPVDNCTTHAGIKNVSIVALTEYNKAHPQESLLNDIINFSYGSYDYFLDLVSSRKATPSVFNHIKVKPGADFISVKTPSLQQSQGENYQFMQLLFTEAPVHPQQKLRITVTFEDGLVLEEQFDVKINEL